MKIEKSIFKNGISAICQKITKITEQLIVIPFFIKYWGAVYYGDYLTITAIPTFFALADFGFGTAVSNTFITKYAAGKKQEAADIRKTGVTILTIFIFIIIIVSLIILTYLYKSNLIFKNYTINASDIYYAIIILILSRTLNLYYQIYEAYYRAARKAHISINYQTMLSSANIIINLIVLSMGGEIVEFTLSNLILVLFFNTIYIIKANNILQINEEFKGNFKKEYVKDLLKKGFGYFISPIWQSIYYQGSTFIVHTTIGSTAVTIFNTIRTLIRSSSQAFSTLITTIYPDFQFEIASGNIKRAKSLFTIIFVSNILIAIIFMIGLSVYGQPLYAWWTNKALNVPNNVWFIFISGILFYAIWFSSSFVFEATNKPYTLTITGLINSILVIIVSWYLCPIVGLSGSAISNLIFDVSMAIILTPLAFEKLDFTMREFKREIFKAFKYILQINYKKIQFK